MADAKPRKFRATARHSAYRQRDDAYTAKVVSPQVLSAFVHANGGGDRALAWVAGRQLGVIDARQLAAIGIRRGGIATRRARGVLTARHRGVYLAGPGPAP